MLLNDEQANRFFDVMDALLLYVNDRFQVVEGFTLDYDTQIGDMKAALVAHALWDNVEIIDEFVRQNPARLPKKCLDTALAWKNALPGLYTVVRYQGDRALMMNDVGVFSVNGVTLDLEGEIGKVPAYVEIVLLPFDDIIVYDGFMQVYDTGGTEEAVRIQDEFENRCARGIVSSASDFVQVASAHLSAERDKQLEALLADVSREAAGVEEPVPEGFHRGVLAGLDTLERAAAISAEFERRGAGSAGLLAASMPVDATPMHRDHTDLQMDQAVSCAIASVISRGVVDVADAYDQYRALVPDPIGVADFEYLIHQEASFSDSYFGLWNYQSRDYLTYYTLTPDYITHMASQGGSWRGLREELEYYENYKQGLLSAHAEVAAKPLSRTLMENTPLGELLGNSSVARLRRFLDERIPDGQDDYAFADLAVQEFVLTCIELGSLDEAYKLVDDLGIAGCTADEERLARLIANVFNAMPSWENNGWSPQELYEQLTGRRVFYNEDGTVKKVGGDDSCPCGSGLKYRECCGR